jgi:GAF domain-containing protein
MLQSEVIMAPQNAILEGHKIANSIIGKKTEQENDNEKKFNETTIELVNTELSEIESDTLIDPKSESPSKDTSRSEEGVSSLEKYKTNFSIIDKDVIDKFKDSRNELIQSALVIVRSKVQCQTVSLFLFSKDGRLELVAFEGVNKEGKDVNSPVDIESYSLKGSFVGMAATPEPGSQSNYGSTQAYQESEALKPDERDKESFRKYIEEFGDINCSYAIPLNGRNKTYGILRVVNKIDLDGKVSENQFTPDELNSLFNFSILISHSLSNFRRDLQSKIFKYLSHLLAQTSDIDNSLKHYCQEAADLLVQNVETAFKACVVRIRKDTSLEAIATSFAPVMQGERVNEDRNIHSGLVGYVAQNKIPIILQNLEDHWDKFRNSEWVKANSLQAFGCFPILLKGECLGTLSLYTGYYYDFHPDSVEFVQGIIDLIASAIHTFQLEKQSWTFKAIKHLLSDPDPAARSKLAEMLGKIDDENSVPTLCSLLKDPDDNVRTAALQALGYIGEKLKNSLETKPSNIEDDMLNFEVIKSLRVTIAEIEFYLAQFDDDQPDAIWKAVEKAFQKNTELQEQFRENLNERTENILTSLIQHPLKSTVIEMIKKYVDIP